MRGRPIIWTTCALLWGTGAASAGCLFGAVQEDLRPLGEQIVANSLDMELADFLMYPGEVEVLRVDLDQDGEDELCIAALTTATCSNGVLVCVHLIWSVTEQSVVFLGAAHRVEFGGWSGAGWQTLRAEYSASDGYVYAVLYDFGDGLYRRTCTEVIGNWAGPQAPPRGIAADAEC